MKDSFRFGNGDLSMPLDRVQRRPLARRQQPPPLTLVTINLLLTSTTTALSMPAPSNGLLSRLAATAGAAPVHRAGHSYEVKDKGRGETSGKYCKYDDIRAMLSASRARSYSQGRDGCCGKAAEHLGLSGPPPPGSPWSRKNAPATASRSTSLVSTASCVDEDATRDASLERRLPDFVGTGW